MQSLKLNCHYVFGVHMNDIIEFILNIIIGLVVPVVLSFRDNEKKKNYSLFYSYIELRYENFVEKLEKKYKVEISVVFSLQIILTIFYYLHIFNFNNIKLDVLISYGNLVLAIFFIAIFITNPLYLKSFKKLDKLINAKSDNLNSWDSKLSICIFIICFIGLIIFLKIEPLNLTSAFVVIYVTLILSLCISVLYTLFVANYVKVRKFYYVDTINIKLSYKEEKLTNIINYKLKRDRYIIKINDNEKYIALDVPSSNIEFIEKIINKDKPMIKILNANKEKK